MARIVLVRHGRSALAHDGKWMHAAGVRDYESAYNTAGIRENDMPPPDLVRAAANAEVLAASDLPRAIASARRLVPERQPDITPLLREIELEPPRWIPWRLPIEIWDGFSHVQWTYRLLLDADHEFMRRASEAAAWLEHWAADAATVVAVTHGGFRRLIANRLAARGWRAGLERRSYANWSTWTFSRGAAP